MLASAFATVALLPGLLTPTVAEVKPQTPLPVLLPNTMRMDVHPLYASGGGSEKEYSIGISSVRDCGANACFVADFEGHKGGRPWGRHKVTLAHGVNGRYTPLSCGGSCSPPILEFKTRGVVYRLQGEFGTAKRNRANLVKMANQAIRRGPR
jgi:hypothetical protein